MITACLPDPQVCRWHNDERDIEQSAACSHSLTNSFNGQFRQAWLRMAVRPRRYWSAQFSRTRHCPSPEWHASGTRHNIQAAGRTRREWPEMDGACRSRLIMPLISWSSWNTPVLASMTCCASTAQLYDHRSVYCTAAQPVILFSFLSVLAALDSVPLKCVSFN